MYNRTSMIYYYYSTTYLGRIKSFTNLAVAEKIDQPRTENLCIYLEEQKTYVNIPE